MDTFLQQFNTLTPQQKSSYTTNNPVVGIGGSQYRWNGSAYTQVEPTSTLGTLSQAPNTTANQPSSSASVIQNSGANNAINATTQPPQQQPKSEDSLSTFWNNLNTYEGSSITPELIKLGVDAGYAQDKVADLINTRILTNQEKQDQLKLLAEKKSAALAQQSAAYASRKAELDNERQKAAHAAVAQAASVGMFEQGGSDAQQYSAAISRQYDLLDQKLQAQAQAEIEAINKNDTEAALSIQQEMAKTYQQGIAEIRSKIQQEQQFKETLKANTQAKATTAFQNSLKTPSITSAQADILSALPSNWNDMSEAQRKQAQNIAGGLWNMAEQTGDYNDANGNFNPSLAWTAIQGGLTNSLAQQKTTSQINAANLRNVLLQNKVLNMQKEKMASEGYLTTQNGGSFAKAYNNIVANGGKDKINEATGSSIHGTIGEYLSNDPEQAKTELKNFAISSMETVDKNVYTSLSTIQSMSNDISKFMNSLPADQKTGLLNGTMNDLFKYLGQTNKPALSEFQSLIDHQSMLYSALLAGKRFTAQQVKAVKDLFPSASDSVALNLAKINALNQTVKTVQDSAMQQIMGAENYNSIYNTVATPQKGARQQYKGATYEFDGTQWKLIK